MNNKELITKLLALFQSRRFEEWYRGPFEDFISGQMSLDEGISNKEAEERIRAGIARLLQIKDEQVK